MDSLYGDLPPPISSKNLGKNENINTLSKQKNYIEINKNIITPVVVQKKIANIKNLNKNIDHKNSENENDINNLNSELKNNNETTKNVKVDNKHLNNQNLKNDTKIEIININKSIQDDLKKISDRLNKIQQCNKNEHTLSSNVNNEEKSNTNIEINFKNKINERITNNLSENNITNNYIKNELYDKYFITNVNEDYDPNKPNDLNKIIKERKRKKLIMLAEKKKKQEIDQIEETKEKDKKTLKDFENNKIYRYNGSNTSEYLFEMEEKQKYKKNYIKNELKDEKKNEEEEYKKWERKNKKGQSYSESEDELKDRNEEKIRKKTKQNTYDDNILNVKGENGDLLNKNKEKTNNLNDIKKEETTVKKDFATRMMEKMGWKKGEGLGKDKQGIKAPLILQKVDKRSGVIIQAPLILKNNDLKNESNPCENKYSSYAINNSCTRIIVLTNMVTVDEIDDTLKDEIEEEASKFGNLLNINIVVDKNSQDALAVKIFCEYESKEQAKNAMNTFNGRIFAGRKVDASFVNENEYYSNNKKN
ncbi:RNA-binding protein, putative [Plasmodium gallinaceum]|uniref:RNA-binding protein, putative n=1 Tax=Plasmodium gallinaceum TaxID=5849 RepID=A0A1J1GQF1_PLAGA|nr:RNA-binding protein, putative [Plasmodium gallinaceum]CRG94735.1 RNA-binding protein, putative [Plasmodium gallinaceum]